MSSSATATATFALAGLVALASFAPGGVLALAVLLVAALVAVGWPELLDLPTPRGTTAVVVVAALGAAGAALVAVHLARTGGTQASGVLGQLPVVAALALLLAFVHQLLRRDGRPRLVESVTGAVSGQAVAVLAAAWIAVPTTYAGPALAPVVLAAVVATSAVSATTWPTRVVGPVNLAVGAAAGYLAGAVAVVLGGQGVVSEGRWAVAGVVAGAGVGLLVSAWRALTHRLPSVRSLPAALAVAAVPVAVSGAAAYLVGRLVLL